MFHVLKYLDIVICVLIAGYACYEFIGAWMHDEKMATRIINKAIACGMSEKTAKHEFSTIDFGDLMFFSAALFVIGIIAAFTWFVSIPALVIGVVAWHIRAKIRESKEKVDV